MDAFTKPHLDRAVARHPEWFIPGAAAVPRAFPLGPLLAGNRNVFDAVALDTGGFLMGMEFLGALDNRAFIGRRRFIPWNEGHFPKKPERGCWYMRLYFLLPLAHEFLRTGGERHARRWMRLLREWRRAHPIPPDPEDYYANRRKERAWFDMQPAWRCLVLMCSAWMLQKSASLGPAEWEEIHLALIETVDYLHRYYRDKGFRPANHHLQQGVVFLSAGLLYPEARAAADWRRLGREIVSQHWAREMLRDGGPREVAGSYNHFIVNLFRDAWLLCLENGEPPPRGVTRAGLQRAYGHLAAVSTDANLSIPFSDSYWFDFTGQLDFLRRHGLLGAAEVRKMRSTSVVFPWTNLAVLRRNGATVLCDATRPYTGHWHPGALGFSLLIDGVPVLADAGSWNYDRRVHHRCLRRPAAHNTVTVDGRFPEWKAVGEVWRWVNELGIDPIRMQRGRRADVVVMSARSRDGGRFEWRRKVTLNDARLTVEDEVVSETDAQIDLLLNACAPVRLTGGSAVLGGGHRLTVTGGRLERRGGWWLDPRNRLRRTDTIRCRNRGRRARFTCVVELAV